MTILQIEHPVFDYPTWKAAFDTDPMRRGAPGMRGYRIHRLLTDPKYVILDCEFHSTGEAEAFLAPLRQSWKRAVGRLIETPQARLSLVAEARTL